MYNFNEQSESTELIGGFRPVAGGSGGLVIVSTRPETDRGNFGSNRPGVHGPILVVRCGKPVPA